MLLGRLTKYGTGLILALVLGLALIGSLPVPARAQSSVDLELDGEGATGWTIGSAAPGDSGTMTVELHNVGSGDGAVTIWVSDIEEADGGEDGAVLDDYLLFNLSGERLTSDIALPAALRALPQSSTDASQIGIETLSAGETLTLVWEWEFPETGEPQNDAQGDSLSFTINYLLEGFEDSPSGGGGVTTNYQKLEIDILGKLTVAEVTSSGEFLHACVATDPDNVHSLKFAQGTSITSVDGEVPRRVEMSCCVEPPSPPNGTEMIGRAYDITGYLGGSVPCALVFDKTIEFTLGYEPDWLPEETFSVVVAYYEEEHGWAELELTDSGVAQVGALTALTDHASVFAILASVEPLPPPTPAELELGGLTVSPVLAEIGEPVTVTATIQNIGGLESSYTLALRINGFIEQSREVTLSAGQSRQLSFVVIKDEPGTYAVTLDSLAGEFIVLAPASSPPAEDIFQWWVALPIFLAAGAIALIVYFLALRSRKRS